jgi:N-acetylglucosaminyldiphosphoundecaprenol N-acetyl-beta-D-mannosaminyltransferase
MMSETPSQFSVMGLPIHLLGDYSDWLMTRLIAHQGCHVVTLNAEMSMQAEQDLVLHDIIRHAELVIPDGAGIVMYMRLYGRKIQRCPGIELAASLLRLTAQYNLAHPNQPLTVFLFGSAPGVAEQAAAICQQKLPGLTIVGTQNGYLTPDTEAALITTLQIQQPHLVFVGLGVPRQELWISQHRHYCPDAVWMGVGGSFDVWAGTKQRAPDWFNNNNLEWLYRLYQEPWRWRRMLALPKFAWRSLKHRVTHPEKTR